MFISYVREDSDRVDRLQRILEAAGIQVWRNTTDLWPGEDWRLKIRSAITDNALVFIACFSEASLARRMSYQNEELALAIEQMRSRRPDDPGLIPVRFDECDIPDLDIGGGRTLRSIQRADLFGDRSGDGAARLVAAVGGSLGIRTRCALPLPSLLWYWAVRRAIAILNNGSAIQRARESRAALPRSLCGAEWSHRQAMVGYKSACTLTSGMSKANS